MQISLRNHGKKAKFAKESWKIQISSKIRNKTEESYLEKNNHGKVQIPSNDCKKTQILAYNREKNRGKNTNFIKESWWKKT